MIYKMFDYKKNVIVFVLIVVLINSSMIINDATLLETLAVLFGLSSLSQAKEKVLFVTFVMIIQYYNAGAILYHLNNYDYLLTRYKSKTRYFNRIIKILLYNTLQLYVVTIMVADIIALFHQQGIVFLNCNMLLNSLAMCCIIGEIQTYLLLKNNKKDLSIWILLIGSMIYGFVSQIISTKLPVIFENYQFIRIIASSILIIYGYWTLRKTFHKEWQQYAH